MDAINAAGISYYSGSCSEIYLEKAFDRNYSAMTAETPVLLCCITTYDVGQPSRLSKRLGKGVAQMFKIKPLRE